jgi:mono/diheme cytochrome c family protein
MSVLSKPNSDQTSFLIPGIISVGILTLLVMLVVMQIRPVNTDHKAAAAPPDPAAVKAGKTTFMMVCAACHSPKATGIQGLGKPLIGSAFFNGHTDAELLAFLQRGRSVNDPLNTTGVMMPARGGRASLTDTDLANVIAYIRSLNAK